MAHIKNKQESNDEFDKFRERLQLSMDYRKMRPIDLARKSGLARASISQYTSGYHQPSWDSIKAMARVLQVDPAWLGGYADGPLPDCYSPQNPEDGKFKRLKNNFQALNEEDQVMLLQFSEFLVQQRGK